MKRIITLFFALATISFSFAQSNTAVKDKKRGGQEAKIKLGQENVSTESRMVDCVWESDFSNASDWVMEYDENDCAGDCGWQIGENLECQGFYPIAPIDSDDGFYAMLDSDAYGGEDGGTDIEDAWLTMSTPANCSGLNNVVVEFDTWYQSYNSERCFIVVSTDGTFPDNLTPDTQHNPSEGIYEVFPDISGDVQANTGNPFTKRVNISQSAGGQSEVWVRFNWTGTWGYAWFIDRVCIAEQPENDIALNYGVISHNATSEEYGRVPVSQVINDVECAGQVFNFGSSDQSNVGISMEVVNSAGDYITSTTFGEDEMYGFDIDGYLDLDATISGPVETDQYVYFTKGVAMDVPADTYTATFDAYSDGDYSGGDYDADNSAVREFAFTENVYSTDGIDVYSNADVGRMGTGSFADASDGFMMFSYYDIAAETQIAGVRIMLDTYAYSDAFCFQDVDDDGIDDAICTVAGGECVVTLRDSTLISAESFDPSNFIAMSDFYIVTQEDVDNGYMDIGFSEPVTVSPNGYMLGIEMYSNGENNNIYILDDETVPQPFYMSMIYIPNDQVYSNGNATGIRMITGSSIGLEENASTFSVYPNPSKGLVNIDLNEPGDYVVQINDVVGKLVSEKTITSNTTLNLSTLDKGIYFVNVSNDETNNITKVIIE